MNVLAAWIHEDTVSHSFMRSVMAVASRWHSTTGQPLPIGETACSTGDLAFARDQTVIGFLETDLDWLWFVDTDAGFRPDTLERLLRAADPQHRPIVGALAYSVARTPDGMHGWTNTPVPTLYRWTDGEPPDLQPWPDIPRNACVQVDGTGSHCILVHRRVYEDIGESWYQRIRLGSEAKRVRRLVGEDLSFCMRAARAGHKIHVHTGIPTSHHKSIWVSRDTPTPDGACTPPTDTA